MKLSQFIQGRDNNFNLIRIFGAFAVLTTHSFALATGSSYAEPFRKDVGMTMGTIAVDAFFATSGFLVTASLFKRKSSIEFLWARFLRIFPALFVMLLLTVFGIGLFFTTMPHAAYLSDPRIYYYFLKCSTLITGVTFYLPAVFEGNPFKKMVNGSLWTMKYELQLYLILAFVWITLRITKQNRIKFFKFAILMTATVTGIAMMILHFFYSSGLEARLYFMFFSGASFYVLKDHITISHLYFWLFLVSIFLSAMANIHLFFVFYTLTISYVLFYLAYVPSGQIRNYNRMGDYSYGVYIYAFPVQQSVASLIPGVSVLSLALISASITFFLAALSWHLLECRALDLKNIYVDYTKKILSV
ncbi:MAG: acyltransferase [Nitrospirae bacterium]|nr:acyltransferase [Nitrospirota bacterium]